MAQASSVAREPSMEEILASIRRIIEDSDVTRQAPEAKLSGDKSASRGEVAQFRRPAAEENENTATLTARNFERPLLQEKANSVVTKPDPVRSSVISAVSAALEKVDEPVLDLKSDLRGSIDGDHDDEVESYVAARHVSANDASVEAPAIKATQSVEASTAAPLPIADPLEDGVESDIQKIISEMMEKEPEAPQAALEKQSAPLASVETKQQVAASFTELSEVVRQERIRSLEAQAEALLRPMLQNWLDENLPAMVERLVREEIERMVRGNQQ
ncbi:PopZ family protein [Brucellaceae bacterium C25G]